MAGAAPSLSEKHAFPRWNLQRSATVQYAQVLFKAMPRKVGLALTLLVALALTEGVGLLLILPLLQLVGIDAQQGAASGISQVITSALTSAGVPITLVSVLGVYVVIMALFALLTRWESITSTSITYEFESLLRQRLYKAIVNTNWLFFSRNRASTFTHALTAEIDRVGSGTGMLLRMLVDAAMLFVYLFVAWQLSVVVTAIVLACGIVLLLVFSRMVRTSRIKGAAISVDTRKLYGAVTEHLDGIKTAKSYGVQERNTAIFSDLVSLVARHYVSSNRNWSNTAALSQIGAVLILSGALIVMVDVLRLAAASVLLLLFLFVRIIPRISSVQQTYQIFINMLPSFANVTAIQKRCEAEAEREVVARDDVHLQRSIELRNVSFAYSDDASSAVEGITMTIPAGATTAIAGSSGAGKSTVADLLMGLLTPADGQVLIDGVSLSAERLYAWRNRIGYVAQDTFLFNDTVRTNLLWAHQEATDDDLAEALCFAAADEFVRKLPEGMETLLGDRGVRLSGGERQRLALARALLRKPSVLILDEATSNLDSVNERRIQEAIDDLHGDMTIIIITHRLSTIRNADIIYVLEDGRLVESGDWATLTTKGGRFFELSQAQRVA